jgi:hypothetical protein
VIIGESLKAANYCNADVINGNGGNNNNASNAFGVSPDFYKSAIMIIPSGVDALLERRLFPDVSQKGGSNFCPDVAEACTPCGYKPGFFIIY